MAPTVKSGDVGGHGDVAGGRERAHEGAGAAEAEGGARAPDVDVAVLDHGGSLL